MKINLVVRYTMILLVGSSLLPAITSAALLEEITVTARKREEALDKIPLTVSAFNESAIEDRGITQLQDIGDYTAGLDFAQAFGRQDFRPSFRGQSNILGQANAGLFIEGIIVEDGAATIPLSALERVEVVKGPQSALYGRSTLAGAINYVLKKPSDEFEGEIYAEYGEREEIRTDVHLSGPLSDSFGVALTVSHYERQGNYNNSLGANVFGTPAIEDDVGGEQTNSVTGVFEFTPNDRLTVTGHFLYDESDDDHYAIELLDSSANNCFRVGVDIDPSTGAPFVQPTAPAGTPESLANNVNLAPYNSSGYYCGRVDVGDVLAQNGGDTGLETSFYGSAGTETDNLRLGLRFEYDISDQLTFTSITGHNSVEVAANIDATFGGGDTRFPVVGVGSPFAVQGFGAPPTVQTRVGFITSETDDLDDFSQELRLAFDNGGRLRAMGGFYYYASELKETQLTSFDTTTSVFNGTPVFNPFDPGFVPATISTSAFYEGAPPANLGETTLESWSIFGSVDYDVTERLTLGLEVRYNEDNFEFDRETDDTRAEGEFTAFLPKFNVSFEATDDILFYANIGKGNKPGGLNTQAGLPSADQPFDEETAWNYEAGLKTKWLDGRLTANIVGYHIDWEDLQLTSTRGAIVGGQPRTFSILENVGEASVTGVEIELGLQVFEWWDMFFAYALADSEIEEFINSVDAGADAGSAFREAALLFGYSPSGDVVISGTQLPQSSKHQFNFSNTFSGNVTAGWSWFLRGDVNFNSKRYAQVYNLAHTGDRTIANIRGGFRSERLDIELWVDNVTDNDDPTALIRYVQANDLTFNPFNRAIGVTLPRKRQFGVTARYRF